MKISNHTTIAGEKVTNIVSAIGDLKEIVKEGGIGAKFKTLSVLKTKTAEIKNDKGLEI